MKNKSFSTLLNAVEKVKTASGGYQKDEFADKYWKLEQDSAGNGYAVIRLLPGRTEEDVPFVQLNSHGFQAPSGRWFIENCPTTIGESCPVCEKINALYSTGQEKDKATASQYRKKKSFIANILVISDPKNPSNEGKVFLWKFGKKLYDKILDKIQPAFADETPMNPFDPIEGANFKIKQRKVDGWPNFDKSEFEAASELGTAKEIAVIVEQLTDLNAIVDPKNFKTYSELSDKFNKVLGLESARKPVPFTEAEKEEDADAKFAQSAAKQTAAKVGSTAVTDDESDDMAYFKSLIDGAD